LVDGQRVYAAITPGKSRFPGWKSFRHMPRTSR
jgi:hypothetical protein